MGKPESVAAEDGRLSAALAAKLTPKLQDALGHPVRREILRTLNRSERWWSAAEIRAQLTYDSSQLDYHLRVLGCAGAIASPTPGVAADRDRTQYVSEVSNDGHVQSVLRATGGWDGEQKRATATAAASPLLTMFRVPRPVRAIRLRGRSTIDAEHER